MAIALRLFAALALGAVSLQQEGVVLLQFRADVSSKAGEIADNARRKSEGAGQMSATKLPEERADVDHAGFRMQYRLKADDLGFKVQYRVKDEDEAVTSMPPVVEEENAEPTYLAADGDGIDKLSRPEVVDEESAELGASDLVGQGIAEPSPVEAGGEEIEEKNPKSSEPDIQGEEISHASELEELREETGNPNEPTVGEEMVAELRKPEAAGEDSAQTSQPEAGVEIVETANPDMGAEHIAESSDIQAGGEASAKSSEPEAAEQQVVWPSESDYRGEAVATPSNPGCYVYTPSGCSLHSAVGPIAGVWTLDSEPGSDQNREACEARKSAYDEWCHISDSHMQFVSKENLKVADFEHTIAVSDMKLPKEIGCYVFTAMGCSSRRTGPKAGVWTKDTKHGSDSGMEACQARKEQYNKWCRNDDFQVFFVAGGEYPVKPKVDCHDCNGRQHDGAAHGSVREAKQQIKKKVNSANGKENKNSGNEHKTRGWRQEHKYPEPGSAAASGLQDAQNQQKTREDSSENGSAGAVRCPDAEKQGDAKQDDVLRTIGGLLAGMLDTVNRAKETTEQPLPQAPGCYIFTATGCASRQYGAKAGLWTKDVQPGSHRSWAACQARKARLNKWCRVDDVQVFFVPSGGDQVNGGRKPGPKAKKQNEKQPKSSKKDVRKPSGTELKSNRAAEKQTETQDVHRPSGTELESSRAAQKQTETQMSSPGHKSDGPGGVEHDPIVSNAGDSPSLDAVTVENEMASQREDQAKGQQNQTQVTSSQGNCQNCGSSQPGVIAGREKGAIAGSSDEDASSNGATKQTGVLGTLRGLLAGMFESFTRTRQPAVKSGPQALRNAVDSSASVRYMQQEGQAELWSETHDALEKKQAVDIIPKEISSSFAAPTQKQATKKFEPKPAVQSMSTASPPVSAIGSDLLGTTGNGIVASSEKEAASRFEAKPRDKQAPQAQAVASETVDSASIAPADQEAAAALETHTFQKSEPTPSPSGTAIASESASSAGSGFAELDAIVEEAASSIGKRRQDYSDMLKALGG